MKLPEIFSMGGSKQEGTGVQNSFSRIFQRQIDDVKFTEGDDVNLQKGAHVKVQSEYLPWPGSVSARSLWNEKEAKRNGTT